MVEKKYQKMAKFSAFTNIYQLLKYCKTHVHVLNNSLNIIYHVFIIL